MNYCKEYDLIDIPDIQSIIKMKKERELLQSFQHRYWQGNDGRWYVYLPDEKKGRVLRKRNTKEEIEKVIIECQTNLLDNPTVKEVFEEWNDYRYELKKIAGSSHTRLAEVFRRHFSDFGQKHVKDLTKEDVIEFLERQIPEHDLSAKSFASLKSVMKGILKRAKRKGYIQFYPDDVFADLDVSDTEFHKNIKEDYEEVFDEDETSSMINYLKNNCDIKNAGVLLLFVSGLRIGELVALKHDDLDPIKNTVKVRRTETRYKQDDRTIYVVKDYPKTRAGVREIVIPSSFRWLIRNLYFRSVGSEYVFEDGDGNRLLTYQIRKREYTVCKKVGVYKKSPHKIRATYDTILLDANIDRRMVKDQMGHAEIKVSENSYHRNRKTYDKKIAIMDSIPEFKSS